MIFFVFETTFFRSSLRGENGMSSTQFSNKKKKDLDTTTIAYNV